MHSQDGHKPIDSSAGIANTSRTRTSCINKSVHIKRRVESGGKHMNEIYLHSDDGASRASSASPTGTDNFREGDVSCSNATVRSAN